MILLKKHCSIRHISASKRHKRLNYAKIQIDNAIYHLRQRICLCANIQRNAHTCLYTAQRNETLKSFKLPEIKNTLSETNPAFNNSMPLVKQYELRKNSPIWIPSSPVILISNSTDCSIPAISDTNYTVPVIHSGE